MNRAKRHLNDMLNLSGDDDGERGSRRQEATDSAGKTTTGMASGRLDGNSYAIVSLEKLPMSILPLKGYKVSPRAGRTKPANDGGEDLPRSLADFTTEETVEQKDCNQRGPIKPKGLKHGKKKVQSSSSTAVKKKRLCELFDNDSDLNETSDFSSGLTPFRKVAARVVHNSKLRKRFSAKLVGHGQKKESNRKPGSETSLNSNNNENPGTVIRATVEEDPGSIMVDDAGPVVKVTRDPGVGDVDLETEDGKTARQQCPLFGEAPQTEAETNNHLQQSMRRQFQHSKPKSEHMGNSGNADTELGMLAFPLPASHFGSCVDVSDKAKRQCMEKHFLCQICQEDISHLPVESRQKHLNDCLDDGATSQLKYKTEKERQKVGEEDQLHDDEEDMKCQFCHKKLGHMNSQRRTQHVNRCMDKVSSTFKLYF